MRALVIGGTGPTGHYMVNGLLERGYDVAILHSGRHEIDEIPPQVEHIHSDAYDPEAFAEALGTRTFDVCIATYGRLRRIAAHMKGRTGRFLSIGGVPAYRGYMNPELFTPTGAPLPLGEDTAELVRDPEEDEKGYRIVLTEEAVFEHHPEAAHFRYPYVYGAYQALPREWSIVRRMLDERPFIVLPDGGHSLHHYGYAENLAHAVLLAVDQPEGANGQIFNAADLQLLTLRQVVEVCARTLASPIEIVDMPWEFATPARPLIAQPWNTHRILDLTKLRTRLGYQDKVAPPEAVARTARWLRDHPLKVGGSEEMVLTDPFDYEAEDRLVAAWRELRAQMPEIAFDPEPGYTLSYSGPGGRPRSQKTFVQ